MHVSESSFAHFFDVLPLSGNKIKKQQECIPVGCVPSATVAVCLRGVPARGGSAPEGLPAPGGVPAPGRGVVSQHALRQTPPPCGQSHRCKNIADGNNAFQ